MGHRARSSHDPGACFVCGGGNVLPALDGACCVCAACCAPLGRLLATAPPASLVAWFQLPSETARSFPSDYLSACAHASDGDVQAHLDLALAYADMGLLGDAVREAGIVLMHSDAKPTRLSALSIAFGRVPVRPGGLSAMSATLADEVARRRLS
ncbi:MAG TPA: hypothetical protein VF316_17240 [Polyangiaceae bacterium]